MKQITSERKKSSQNDDDGIIDEQFTLDNQSCIDNGSASINFISKNLDELCDRLRLIFQKMQKCIYTKRFDDKIVARIEKLIVFRCITPTQHKKN